MGLEVLMFHVAGKNVYIIEYVDFVMHTCYLHIHKCMYQNLQHLNN